MGYASAFNEPAKSKRSMMADLARGGVSPVSAKLVAKNTLLYTLADNTLVLRFHNTDILTWLPDGSRVVDTGGYNTVTTRARLNDNGVRCYTSKSILYIQGVAIERRCTILSDGTVQSDVVESDLAVMRRKIDRYMTQWKIRGLPSAADSAGYPWVFGPGKVSRETMLDWLDSGYVHRRLYALACEYAGCNAGIWLHMADSEGGKLNQLETGRIRRYVRACLGLAA